MVVLLRDIKVAREDERKKPSFSQLTSEAVSPYTLSLCLQLSSHLAGLPYHRGLCVPSLSFMAARLEVFKLQHSLKYCIKSSA